MSNQDNSMTNTSSNTNINNHNSNNSVSNNVEETPMALLEQLVYIDNFFQQTDSPSNQTDEFDDQLQRELAAFANDTFIFPDEEKPKQSSSNNNNNNDSDGNGNGISISHVFESIDHPSRTSNPSPIPQNYYQDLSQKYNDSKQKHKNAYQESLTQHMLSSSNNNINNTNTNINTNTNNNTNNSTNNVNRNNSNMSTSSQSQINTLTSGTTTPSSNNTNIPLTIRELLDGDKKNSSLPSNMIKDNSTKPQIPLGAQHQLAAAGLSQTQIDALGSLVAFHKSENSHNRNGNNGNVNGNGDINNHPLSINQGLNSISQATSPNFNSVLQSQVNGSNGSNALLVNLLTQALVNNTQQPQNNLINQLIANMSNPRVSNDINDNSSNTISLLLQLQQQQQQQALNLQQLITNQMNIPKSDTMQPSSFSPIHSSSSSSSISNLGLASAPGIKNNSLNTKKNNTITFKNSHLDMKNNKIDSKTKKNTISFATPIEKPKLKNTGIHITNSNNSTSDSNGNAFNSDNDTSSSLLANGKEDSEKKESERSAKGTASVRFRQKKKQKEQEMEKNLEEAKQLAESLQVRIQQLEMENRLLRDLVVEKSQKRSIDEVERLRKKAKLQVKNEMSS